MLTWKVCLKILELHTVSSYALHCVFINFRMVESKGSLSHTQQPATRPYPETEDSNPHKLNFIKLHHNIMLPSTPTSLKESLLFMFSDKNFV